MKWSQICRMVPQHGLARGNEIPYQISRIRERVSGKTSIPTSDARRSGLGMFVRKHLCVGYCKREAVCCFICLTSFLCFTSCEPVLIFCKLYLLVFVIFISNYDFCFNLLSVFRGSWLVWEKFVLLLKCFTVRGRGDITLMQLYY